MKRVSIAKAKNHLPKLVHDAEKGRELEVDAERQSADTLGAIDGDMRHMSLGEILRQRPAQGVDAAEAPAGIKLDCLDPDLEHVTGHRP